MDWILEDGFSPVLARFAADAGMLTLFGSCLFAAGVAPRALACAPAEVAAASSRRLRRLAHAACVLAAATTLLWLIVQAHAMARPDGAAALPRAVWLVATQTRFGRICAAQLALALLAGIVLRRSPRVAASLAGVATLAAAAHGHGAAMAGLASAATALDALHLLAAGAWLGALPPLLLMTLRDPPPIAAQAARWFSPPGQLYVAAVALTAALQGLELVGSVPGLVGTAYGATVLVKVALLAILVAYALANRYRFAPALLGQPAPGRRALLRSLTVQSAFGVAVIGAAALLASLPPPIHVPAGGDAHAHTT